jgi:serine protease Do
MSSEASNIGFAIPIDQVMAVLPQLKERGRVSRGYIGVEPTDATPELRKSLRFGPLHGAVIEDVTADTPADRAGLRVYDLITAIDDKAIQSSDDLIRHIAARSPGSIARLTVWRDGTTRTVPIRLTERPLPISARAQPVGAGVRPTASQDQTPLGLTVKDLDASTIRRLNIPDAMIGVLITDVDPAGPAHLARIRSGQILLEINRHHVSSTAEFRALVATLRPGDSVALYVGNYRTDQRSIHVITLDPQ